MNSAGKSLFHLSQQYPEEDMTNLSHQEGFIINTGYAFWLNF